jgi:hypothetical protein
MVLDEYDTILGKDHNIDKGGPQSSEGLFITKRN